MTDFRDAIAMSLPPSFNRGWLHNRPAADAVLAMPEMQAIREALKMLHVNGGPGYLDYLDLPESVIAWVVGDE